MRKFGNFKKISQNSFTAFLSVENNSEQHFARMNFKNYFWENCFKQINEMLQLVLQRIDQLGGGVKISLKESTPSFPHMLFF